MSAGDAGMAGNVGLGRAQLDYRQAVIKGGVGLARVVDQLDGAVPHRADRTRIADRDE